MGKELNILVACEESQTVCKEFRGLGHNAFSCDLQECSGGHPEWHIRMDARLLLEDGVMFVTDDGETHYIEKWDLIIAHPPCTYMSKAGARWMYPTAGNISEKRYKLAMEAKKFFMTFLNCNCEHIAVENPVPLKVVELPKSTQAIQPYEYGEPYSKKTLLWLKGLPKLEPTDICENYTPYLPSNTGAFSRGGGGSRGVAHDAKTASKTFEGIAKAMAEQWSRYLEEEHS